ncbi:MAG: hypothetical protein IPN76_30950 [Saprospiraceae bacterium]|nr:hypothetical protein [Saprospiraceae bacterium]
MAVFTLEQNNIKAYLKNLEERIAKPKFGADVRSFYKTSTDPIQVSQAEELNGEFINNGTSMITFIGHSTPGSFDFNIDNPDNFENKGRYPSSYRWVATPAISICPPPASASDFAF